MNCYVGHIIFVAYSGAIFRKYPTTKTKHRGVKKIHIADKEEQITTKDVGSVVCPSLIVNN